MRAYGIKQKLIIEDQDNEGETVFVKKIILNLEEVGRVVSVKTNVYYFVRIYTCTTLESGQTGLYATRRTKCRIVS